MVDLSGAAIVGIGRTAFTRRSGRTGLALAAEAVRAALDDCGLAAADVDGITCFSTGDPATPTRVAYAIGIDDVGWAVTTHAGGNAVATVMANAAAAVITGLADVVVVYRVLDADVRFGKVTGPVAVPGPEQFAGPHGYLVPPQWFAMWAKRQHVYGSTSEDLGAIAINNRAHAANNPHAIARDPITLDDYLAGRWVVEPFRVFDCAYEVDGAVALVVTSAERAADLRHAPVYPIGAADSTGAGGMPDLWDDQTAMYSRDAAPRLWARTGLRPADMDLACMYDCFTYTIMATFEDFGFCEKGGVGDYFREGRATYGGDVVVNPHGGLLSEGYLHGLNHHFEAVLQLRGGAGVRQVPDAQLALVTAGAGPYGGAIVYGGHARERSGDRPSHPAATATVARHRHRAVLGGDRRRTAAALPLPVVPALAAAASRALPAVFRADCVRAGQWRGHDLHLHRAAPAGRGRLPGRRPVRRRPRRARRAAGAPAARLRHRHRPRRCVHRPARARPHRAPAWRRLLRTRVRAGDRLTHDAERRDSDYGHQ